MESEMTQVVTIQLKLELSPESTELLQRIEALAAVKWDGIPRLQSLLCGEPLRTVSFPVEAPNSEPPQS